MLKLISSQEHIKPNHFYCYCKPASVIADVASGEYRIAHGKTLHTLETRQHQELGFQYSIYKCTCCGHEMQTEQQSADYIEEYQECIKYDDHI